MEPCAGVYREKYNAEETATSFCHVPDLRCSMRIALPKGTFAFYQRRALGQIIDLSRHGLSFRYVHDEGSLFTGPFLPEEGEIEIISQGQIRLRGVPGRVVANFELGPVTPRYPKVSLWRCCLCFQLVVNEQAYMLKRYLLELPERLES